MEIVYSFYGGLKLPLPEYFKSCGNYQLVITVMDEEQNIKPLLESVRMALTGIDYEIVLVDDGSADKTRQQVLEYADERTILAELRKKYDQSTAMTAGIDYSRGKYIALLDGDLQNDPTDIPPMPELLKK